MNVHVEALRLSEQHELDGLAGRPVPDGAAGLAAGTFVPVDAEYVSALGLGALLGDAGEFESYVVVGRWRRHELRAPWSLSGRRLMGQRPAEDGQEAEFADLGAVDLSD